MFAFLEGVPLTADAQEGTLVPLVDGTHHIVHTRTEKVLEPLKPSTLEV